MDLVSAGRRDDGQVSLFDASEHRRVGRVEQLVAGAVTAAELDPRDLGAAALAVELARAVDVASTKRDPYGVAAAARELRECLSRLRLDPTARGDGLAGQAADFLAGLGAT